MTSDSHKGTDDYGVVTAQRDTPSGSLRRAVLLSLALFAIFLLGASFTTDIIATVLLRQQDIWLIALSISLAGLALLPILPVTRPLVAGRCSVLLIALAVALIGYAGHRWLLLGYDFTRDEQMASFDAAIFSAGRLVWPLPMDWQTHAAQLNLRFMPEAAPQLAWVSGYLPMNAALRALFGLIGDAALVGPISTGLSALLLWSCARRIWPDKPETAIVCVLMLVSAGQVLMAGMTAYAMPVHLIFNLLWLRLFLAKRRVADVGAIAAGFIATGLHQPLFHPMFVAPFMLLLLVERDWRRLMIFVPAYAAIGLFWLYWPVHIQALITGPHAESIGANGNYLTRLAAAISANRDNISTMAANMLRFFTWQNVLLLPLMLAGWRTLRKDRFAAALLAGFLLPALVMMLILPSQGYGFGYRYFHGVLGNAMLLAGYGWNRLAGAQAALRSSVLRATAASLLVLLPVQAWMAHRLYAPFAQASARIDASGADYALIPEGNLLVLHDLVLNRPDLSNRPIRLVEPLVADPLELAGRICRPGVTVAQFADSFFDPIADSLGVLRSQSADDRLRVERLAFEHAGCGVRILE